MGGKTYRLYATRSPAGWSLVTKNNISRAIVDFIGVMKINVYTTHDKLSAMTEATSERVIWRNARLATLNPDHAQPYGLLERHALLVRGRIAAIVAEDDAPAGAVSISKAGWLRRD
jgi:hypothetical protein